MTGFEHEIPGYSSPNISSGNLIELFFLIFLVGEFLSV